MLRKLLLLGALTLVLPTLASADSSTDYALFGNVSNGTASITGSAIAGGTLSVTSMLTEINGVSVPHGSVSLTTGTLTAGAVTGTFTFTGGTIDITNSKSQTLFQGTFTTGSVTVSHGVWFINAVASNGGSITLQIHGRAVSGDAIVAPEPGTLSLMGTGLIGLAGALRRKFKMNVGVDAG
jgi:hypothetical protein